MKDVSKYNLFLSQELSTYLQQQIKRLACTMPSLITRSSLARTHTHTHAGTREHTNER